MTPLPQAVGPWHEFYGLVGTASATLIGLLFVAASVGSGIFSPARPQAVRAFLSSSVVHFTCVLVTCLFVLAPIGRWEVLGALVAAQGGSGLIYAGLVWQNMARAGLTATLDLSDRLCYAKLPAAGYAALTASGAAFCLRLNGACALLALTIGALLLLGIRNAWDITIWAVIRRNQAAREREPYRGD